MPVVSGFLSVTDVIDGAVGTAVIFTNENHTYVANADGAVSAAERTMFSSFADVEAGSANFTYIAQDTTTLTTNSRFTIASTAVSGQTYRVANGITVTPTSADLEVRLTPNGDGVDITIVDMDTTDTTGFFDAGGANSATITVPVAVRFNGTTTTFNKIISLSKAVGGSAPYVRMTATDQSVEYAFAASTPKDDTATFSLNALAFNTPTTVGTGANTGVWFYSNNGSTWTALDGTEAGVTLTNGNSDNSTLQITHSAFDTQLATARRVLYRYARQTNANTVSSHEIFDQISVFKVEDAEGGYSTYVEVVGGTTAFKNSVAYSATDDATYGDIRIRVYAAGNVEVTSSNTSSLTYQWTKNGVNLAAADLTLGDAAQNAIDTNYGVDGHTIRIVAEDVEDNGADVFGCTVDFTYTG